MTTEERAFKLDASLLQVSSNVGTCLFFRIQKWYLTSKVFSPLMEWSSCKNKLVTLKDSETKS